MFKLHVGFLFLLLFFHIYCIDKEEHYRQCISAVDERFLNTDTGMLSQTQIDFIRNLYEQVYHCAKDSALSVSSTSSAPMPISTHKGTFISNLMIFDNIFENFAALTVILGSIYEIYCRFQYHQLQQQLLIAGLPEAISISASPDASFDNSNIFFPRQSLFSIKQIAGFPYKAIDGTWNNSFKGKII